MKKAIAMPMLFFSHFFLVVFSLVLFVTLVAFMLLHPILDLQEH